MLERGSAANLLVFNTAHNPYVEWRRLDNLSGEEEQAGLTLPSYHPSRARRSRPALRYLAITPLGRGGAGGPYVT